MKLETEPLACAFGVCWGASALCQAVEQGVEEMTAILALTFPFEGRQLTQERPERAGRGHLCSAFSIALGLSLLTAHPVLGIEVLSQPPCG